MPSRGPPQECCRGRLGFTSFPQVQVPNNHILSKNSNLHNYYPKTEYLIIGSFGPLRFRVVSHEGFRVVGFTS